YVVGGDNPAGELPTVEAYDPVTNSWSTVAPLPTPGDFLGVVEGSNTAIYVFGADDANRNATQAYVNPLNDRWTTLPALPTPRHGMGAALDMDGTIHLYGGFGNKTGYYTSQVVFSSSTGFYSSAADLIPVGQAGTAFLAGATGPD